MIHTHSPSRLRHLSLAFIILTQTLDAMYGPGFGTQPTSFMGAVSADHQVNEVKDAYKHQSKDLANIEDATTKFEAWIDGQKILGSTFNCYQDICARYNKNQDREAAYVAYMQTPESSTSIHTPVGYRLPIYRTILPPFSEVIKKYRIVRDILSPHADDANVAAAATGVTEYHRLIELTNLLTTYQGKYSQNIQTGPPDQDIINRTAIQTNKIAAWQAQINSISDGLTLYLTSLGILEDALVNHVDDLTIMACGLDGNGGIEDILKNKINGKSMNSSTFGQLLTNFIVARYSSTPDDKHNPFTMTINDPSDQLLGVALKDLQVVVNDYRASLLDAAKKIHDLAVPPAGIVDSVTPMTPNNYFDPAMIPPDIDQMETTGNGLAYMYPGYLGYWLQQIVDRLHECTLLGSDIINGRITLLNMNNNLSKTYILANTVLYERLTTEPIFNDPTAPSINLSAILSVLQSDPNDLSNIIASTGPTYQKEISSSSPGSCQAIVKHLQHTTPLLFDFTSTTYPNGVPELFKLRRTLFLITVLNTLASVASNIPSQKPLDPSAYTDIFSTLKPPIPIQPTTFFPQLTSGVSS